MGTIRRRVLFAIPAGLLAIAACVTVNIYFPAARVEKTAERIVGEVYQQGESPPPKPSEEAPPDKPRSSREPGASGRAWAWFGPAEARADEGSGDGRGRGRGRGGDREDAERGATSVSNAAIRALKDQIAQRHQQLLPYYQQGHLGINREGYLEVRATGGLSLAQLVQVKRLVEADNAARRQLYQEVARALDIKPEQVRQVEEIFAREWREKAQAGWWVQADDGKWGRK